MERRDVTLMVCSCLSLICIHFNITRILLIEDITNWYSTATHYAKCNVISRQNIKFKLKYLINKALFSVRIITSDKMLAAIVIYTLHMYTSINYLMSICQCTLYAVLPFLRKFPDTQEILSWKGNSQEKKNLRKSQEIDKIIRLQLKHHKILKNELVFLIFL